MKPLDPWDDAAEIATRLHRPGSVLMVLIGAEAWCQKCRDLRPHFDALRTQLPANVVALWMDLEEHAEFLGEYVPESLPELCIYRSRKLSQKTILDGSLASLQTALQAPPVLSFNHISDPGLFQRLVQDDWAM